MTMFVLLLIVFIWCGYEACCQKYWIRSQNCIWATNWEFNFAMHHWKTKVRQQEIPQSIHQFLKDHTEFKNEEGGFLDNNIWYMAEEKTFTAMNGTTCTAFLTLKFLASWHDLWCPSLWELAKQCIVGKHLNVKRQPKRIVCLLKKPICSCLFLS